MRLLLVTLAALSLTAPAQAQETQEYHVTKFQDLALSMEALLNDGYAIVNESVAQNGANFLLRHENKWITCSLKGTERDGKVIVGSRCVALN
jgi:hypothetical protein